MNLGENGISFFLSFDPELQGHFGESSREEVALTLRQRFIKILADQCPKENPLTTEQLERTLVATSSESQPRSGEIYFFSPGTFLKRGEFALMMMREIRSSVEKDPIKFNFNGRNYEIKFYGWGSRCF
jgi:hypothetical protein